MVFIGMDVHLKSTSVCVFSQNGEKLQERTIKGRWPKVVDYIKTVKAQYGRIEVCFEAGVTSGLLHDKLNPIADRVVVAHPGKLRLISHSKRKNDKIDARKLAKLLYVGMVPPVHVPNVDVREWRSLIEYRNRLVREKTRYKNEVRSLLNSQGIKPHPKLWTNDGMAWLRGLELEGELMQLKLEQIIISLDCNKDKLRGVERMLRVYAKRHPGVTLLMTIPGIGIRTAECMVAYIDDPRRFKNAGKVGAYFGLVPSLNSTGGKDHLGHITKEGPATARRMLVESAWIAVRRSDTVRAKFEDLVGDDPDNRKIAIVAVAHYLARVCYGMLKTGECWREAA